MSRTLFWYIFKDLLKIFLMASGVLAGIMSFCGLLKPLTEHGLNAGQVLQMLTYFLPATQTYSLPLAALFATAVVYGRLSADNELTACRASGISYLSLAAPALVLGLTMAIVSLLGLCFIVPHYTLKVEKVIFSNLAALVQNDIQRTHQIRLGDATVYAQTAQVAPSEAAHPDVQRVVMSGVVFVTSEPDKAEPKLRIPKEFWMADTCTVFIHLPKDDSPAGEDQVTVLAALEGGIKLPRELTGGVEAAVDEARFGPMPMDSPIRENTKFMDIRQLKALYADPSKSKRIRKLLASAIDQEQELLFRTMLLKELTSTRNYRIADPQTGDYVLTRGDKAPKLEKQGLILTSDPDMHVRQVKLESGSPNRPSRSDHAAQVRVRVQAENETDSMLMAIELYDVQSEHPDGQARHASFTRHFSVPMPEEVKALRTRQPTEYINATAGTDAFNAISRQERDEMDRNLKRLTHGIQSELHARVSFGISCLILVIMGCALGMMFHSGNFLNAFAVSAVPALLSIALIVTGQHVGENNLKSLGLGLGLIWSGNVIVLVLAIVFLWRLQRQ